MSDNIVIRHAVKDDVEGMLRVLEELFGIEEDFHFDHEKQRKGLNILLDNPERCCVMVADKDGEIAGMCQAQTLISTAEGDYVAYIEDMVIHESYRRHGLGKRLLSGVEEWCRKNGLKRIQLLADLSNEPALNFYKKNNWAQTNLICFRRMDYP
ncbi:GNAT family N-acetyltransferase [Limisalsivibrio acetivorans]|uniref:GNAT family N-acetyltransferase n=1 Tax=Limisalsivibrio acetivorans TaxID=1304888 RepID=UPI0003B51E14|nr:GNAT family N-acetyltransferase [Limisalsivibrio acetivorans]